MDSKKKTRKFKCLFCEKTFLKKYNWQRHCKNVHNITVATNEKEKPIKCMICKKQFSQKKVLYDHCRKKHEPMLDHLDIPFKRRRNKTGVNVRKKPEVVTPEQIAIVKEHLPDEYEYNVLLFNKIDENKFQFRVKFEVKELDEVSSFLESYKVKNCIRFRLAKVNPLDKGTLYHKQFCCHHNSQKKMEKNRKNTNCPATASILVKKGKEETDDSNKMYCFFRASHNHNHDFDETETKYLLPNSQVAEKFRALLLSGLPPFKALKQYKEELQAQYGDEYPKISKNRSICPNQNWVYSFYYKIIKEFEGKIQIKEEEIIDEPPNIKTEDETIEYLEDEYQTDDEAENMEIEYLEDEFDDSGNVPLPNDMEVILSDTRTKDDLIVEDFEKSLFDMINRVTNNFDQFRDAVEAFCGNYRKLKSDDELATALSFFGTLELC